MPHFSQRSITALATAHPHLQMLFYEIVRVYDCIVLEGKRSEEQQRMNVAKGVSKTLNSKHVYPLEGPSMALDVAPYPLKWPKRNEATYVKDVARYYHFAGYVKGIAEKLGLQIRWGGDWDGDDIFIDQTFDDLVHFELLEG